MDVNNEYMVLSPWKTVKPRMVSGARTEHWGVQGEWANLTCAVHAEPPARFEWVHKNRSLSASDEVFILSPQENISILQVSLKQCTTKASDTFSTCPFTYSTIPRGYMPTFKWSFKTL